jgi:hypothetical protein
MSGREKRVDGLGGNSIVSRLIKPPVVLIEVRAQPGTTGGRGR